jgi:mannose/fructose/N-acetylgalactosamine-specific phosphotransferase system component IID
MFLRSFLIQATWNYRTLSGAGFAFVMLPVLRTLFGHDATLLRAAVVRHAAVFNSHPYLVGIAAGAVARMEMDGADARIIDRFKAAVRGSLGTLGDQLIWAGWRPLCALFALVLLVMGAPWWVVCGVFLIAYNTGHLLVRAWGFRLGWSHGTGVAERLRRTWIADVQQIIATVSAFLLGLLLPLIATGGTLAPPQPVAWVAAAAVGAVLGLRFGGALRTPVVLALGALALIGLLAGLA